MFAIFKNHNPFAVIALFILSIITRLVYITQVGTPLVLEGQYMWQWLVDATWVYSGAFSYLMFFLLICNVFGQALLINWISTRHGLFPKYSYLPAYTFVLLSALLPEWNQWNVFMILNWLLLILLNNVLRLYLTKKAKTLAFNVGFVSALMAILLFPGILVLLMALAGLAILRPFKVAEWVSLFLGFFLPYYFFVSICYLTDAMYLTSYLYRFDFELAGAMNAQQTGAGALLLASIVICLYYTGFHINRMVVETKKYWSVILVSAFTCLGMVMTTMHDSYAGVLLLIAPVALFVTFNYYEQFRKWIPDVFAFLLLTGVLCIQWLLR